MHYTYLLQSDKDKKWYTGCTSDLKNRLKQHNAAKVYATKNRGPFQLVYYEACHNEQDAFAREKYLKSGMGKKFLKNRLRRFLSLTGLAILIFIMQPPTASAAVLSRAPNNLGLVGYWPMNEGTGSQAGDMSGKKNTGTLTNMESTDWVAGRRGKALSFDGVNEYVDILDNDSLSFSSGGMTFSAWVKFNSLSGAPSIMRKDATSQREYGFYVNSSQLRFFVFDNNNASYIGRLYAPTLTTGVWYHMVATYDGGTTNSSVKLYINGIQVDDTNFSSGASFSSMRNTTSSLRVGDDGYGTGYINGLIDDSRIYSRALTASSATGLWTGRTPTGEATLL